MRAVPIVVTVAIGWFCAPAHAQDPAYDQQTCCCCQNAQPPCVLPPLPDDSATLPPEAIPTLPAVPRVSPRLTEDAATAAARAAIRHDGEVGLAFGAGLMATGLVIAAVHMGATSTGTRWYDLVPVTGPAVVAFTEPSEGWTSALLFSGWLEAAGIMTMAIAGSQLAAVREHPPAVELSGSVSSGKAGISVSGHF